MEGTLEAFPVTLPFAISGVAFHHWVQTGRSSLPHELNPFQCPLHFNQVSWMRRQTLKEDSNPHVLGPLGPTHINLREGAQSLFRSLVPTTCPGSAPHPLPHPHCVSFHPLQLAGLSLLTSSSHLVASQLRKSSLALCLNWVQTLHSGLSDPPTVIALVPVTHNAFATCHALWFPRWLSGKATCQFRRHGRRGFNPWVGKIPWRRKWQPTPWGNLRDRGAWWAVGHGVTKSRARLSGHHSWVVLSTSHTVICFILTTLCSRHGYCPHFTAEEAELQRGYT